MNGRGGGRWITYRRRGEEERVGDVRGPVERSSTTREIYTTFECGAFVRWKLDSVGWERYYLPGAWIIRSAVKRAVRELD